MKLSPRKYVWGMIVRWSIFGVEWWYAAVEEDGTAQGAWPPQGRTRRVPHVQAVRTPAPACVLGRLRRSTA